MQYIYIQYVVKSTKHNSTSSLCHLEKCVQILCCVSPVASNPLFMEAIKNKVKFKVNNYVLKLTQMAEQYGLCVHTVDSFLSVQKLNQHRYGQHQISLSCRPALPCPALCSPPKELPLICLPQDCLCAPDHCHIDTILKLIVTVQEPQFLRFRIQAATSMPVYNVKLFFYFFFFSFWQISRK